MDEKKKSIWILSIVFAVILILSAAAFFTGHRIPGMIIWAAGVITEIIIIISYRRYLLKNDDSSETEDESGFSSDPGSEPDNSRDANPGSVLFTASSVYDTVADEYCIANGRTRESLNDQDQRKIYEYACTPVSYLFLWAAKHSHLSERCLRRTDITSLLIDGLNPAEFISKKMDSRIEKRDFSDEIQRFVSEYFENGTSFSGDPGRSYENDYYLQTRNPWNVYYCIDFTRDIYEKMDERIEESYRFFRCNDEWTGSGLRNAPANAERKFSETLGTELEVVRASGLYSTYVEKCLKNADIMPSSLSDEICRLIIRRYFSDITDITEDEQAMVFSKLSSGRIIIPAPHGDETAYILCFDAEFAPDGIGIIIRDGEVIDITGRNDADSPWIYKNDLKFRIRKSLRYTDVESIDALGKALSEYSSGTLEQSVIIPEFTGAPVPEENRLFVPAPVSEIKNRNDIIAEKMFREGKADRYECSPVYRDTSFVPASVTVALYLKDKNVFLSAINIW